MKLSPQLKINIGKVALITISFMLISLFIAFFNEALLRSPYSLGSSDIYNLNVVIVMNLLMGFISGIIVGTMLVFVNSRLFRRKSFRFALLTTAISYVLIFLIIIVLYSTISAVQILDSNTTVSEVAAKSFQFMLNFTMITYFILWGTITMLTLFLLQVNDKFGPGILIKFLMGKYHQPKEEERIFLFVDMRSSTTIAEKIGNAAYFNLLSDLFTDLTQTILNHEGEIYQYVGDEVVISWPLKKGIHHANCLRCFMQIQAKLTELAPIYLKKYGVAPELKAGLHYGRVTAGEVGSIKKDIIYSGDVLNTTSRIQEQCNHYKVDFLLSKQIADLIIGLHPYELLPLGNIELRGKEAAVEISTVKMTLD